MIEKVDIIQDNYEKILEVAEVSNSINDLSRRLGWKGYTINLKVKDLLLKNNFDLTTFPHLHLESSLFNDKEKLEAAVKKCFSYKEVVELFTDRLAGGHYISLKRYIKKFNLDVSHFSPYKLRNKYKKIANKDIFILNSSADCATVRRRLIKENIIPYKCKCGNDGHWQNQKMSLQLDHKNGNRKDQRIENLEFLCPNCHSITPTFGSKNKVSNKRTKKVKEEKRLLIRLNNTKSVKIKKLEENKKLIFKNLNSYNCLLDILNEFNIKNTSRNYHALNNFLNENKTPEVEAFLNRIDRTVKYPELTKLEKLISQKGYPQVAQELGCSDRGLRKHVAKRKKRIVQYPSLPLLKEMIAEKGYSQVAKELECTHQSLRKHIALHDADHISIPNKKVTYPEVPVLISLVKEKGYLQVGKDLGCSDNAIRKYLKKNRIELKTLVQ